MDYPVCDACAKSGILCASCARKLEDGEVTPLDVEISRFLSMLELKTSIPTGFKKAIDFNEYVMIVVPKQYMGIVIGKEGMTVKKLANRLGKNVKIAGASDDISKCVEDLVAPSKVASVSKVFKADGKEVLNVSIDMRGKLPFSHEELSRIIKTISGKDVEISFV